MGEDRPSTARGRELGDALRVAIKKAGVTGKFIAEKLDWSETKLSHMLSGRRGVSEADIAALLALTGVVGERREELLELCRESHKQGWWQRHKSRLPAPLRTLIAQEDAATALHEYQSMVIPGLLQTAEYMRELLRASTKLPEREIDELVTARLARQGLLSRHDPPSFTFYIDEYALRREGPGPEVMAEQLGHLARLSKRKHISIRVIPGSSFHAGTTGSFRLTTFPAMTPVVRVESAISILFIEKDDEVKVYQDILEELDSLALGAEESRMRIAHWATDLE